MEFIHEEGEKRGRFHTEDGLAEIVYRWHKPDAVVVEHTEVDPSLSGQGIGKQLVKSVAKWARERQIRILPQCSFARAMMEGRQEYEDVLYKG